MTACTEPTAPPLMPPKDPSSRIDYSVDFAALGVLEEGEALIADAVTDWQVVSEPPELEIAPTLEVSSGDWAFANDDTTATVWLEGGTAGVMYRVTCHAPVTDHAPARTLNDVSFFVFVQET